MKTCTNRSRIGVRVGLCAIASRSRSMPMRKPAPWIRMNVSLGERSIPYHHRQVDDPLPPDDADLDGAFHAGRSS